MEARDSEFYAAWKLYASNITPGEHPQSKGWHPERWRQLKEEGLRYFATFGRLDETEEQSKKTKARLTALLEKFLEENK